jgi:hypothetical protein
MSPSKRLLKSSSCLPDSRPPRGCRAFQQRVVRVLDDAVASWRSISGLPCPSFGWFGGSCPELACLVKKFLSMEVSSDISFQMGFQSIKKLLPDSCRCMESGLLDDLIRRLGAPPTQMPSQYLSFVKSEVRRLFPKGWDRAYESNCLVTCPPLSSCCESGRSTGGALGVLSGQSWFLDRVLHGQGKLLPSYRGKLLVVQSAGKPRPLSKFPAEAVFLKPLHKTIYGSLSSKAWLLRGPPSRDALRRAGFVEGGGVLVSGDYRSATDNLPIEVMELALSIMLDNATFVPDNVRELARRACRPILFSEKDSLEVTRGQMMGSLLSFPFLCLQNYLAFRWSVSTFGIRGRVPVVINGDDILFQASDPSFPDHWFKVVGRVGLEVEETKTSVSFSFGSLNSTLLRWVKGFLEPAWSPRFGMFRPAEHPGSLGASFLSFLFECPVEVRYRAGREWFLWHIGELRSAGVSLPSLGFRGLLAMRLAKKNGLLYRPNVEFPRAFSTHGVGFTADFVVSVPRDMVDAEIQYSSSIEVAAAMWSEGWAPIDRTRSAILYCLSRSALKGNRFDYPSVAPWFLSTDEEFAFRLSNLGHGSLRVSLRKSFLRPFPSEKFVLISSTVFDSLCFDFGRGPLPPYSELPSPGEYFEVLDGVWRCG